MLNALLNRDVFSLPHVGGSAARAHLSVCPRLQLPHKADVEVEEGAKFSLQPVLPYAPSQEK